MTEAERVPPPVSEVSFPVCVQGQVSSDAGQDGLLAEQEQGQAQKADRSRGSGEAEWGCCREREGNRYDVDDLRGRTRRQMPM